LWEVPILKGNFQYSESLHWKYNWHIESKIKIRIRTVFLWFLQQFSIIWSNLAEIFHVIIRHDSKLCMYVAIQKITNVFQLLEISKLIEFIVDATFRIRIFILLSMCQLYFQCSDSEYWKLPFKIGTSNATHSNHDR
jgi:hypothetical protein